MMNIILVIGLLTLSQSLHGHNANDLSASSTDPIVQKVMSLCSILPHPLNDNCIKIISLTSREDIEDILITQNLKVLYEIIDAHDKGKLGSFEGDIVSKDHVENPAECLLCKLIMKALQKMLDRNPSREKIERALGKVCNIFHGQMKGKCQKFVSRFAGKIVDLLLKKNSPRIICKLLMLCSDVLTNEEVKIIDTLQNWNELLADSTNKKEIQYDKENEIKEEKSENSIQTVSKDHDISDVTDPIVQKVMSLCSILPHPLNDNCIKMISLTSREDIEDILKTQNLKVLYEIIEAHDKGKLGSFEGDIVSKDHVENPAECLLCKLVMKALEKLIDRNPSREKIEKALGKVCKIFHGKLKSKCYKFISKFSGKIVDFLLKKYSPKVVCKLLMLCSDSLTTEEMNIIDTLLDQKELLSDSTDEKEEKNDNGNEMKQDDGNPLECKLCKKVLKELIKLIGRNKSKDEIEKALRKVCHILPGFLRHKCENFVHKYQDRIVQYIMGNLDPSKICSLLHLCSTNDAFSVLLERANVL